MGFWRHPMVHCSKAIPVFSIENLQFSSLVSSSRIIGWLAYGITFLRSLFYLQIERVTVLVPDQNIWSLQKKVQRKSHGYKSRGKAYEGNGYRLVWTWTREESAGNNCIMNRVFERANPFSDWRRCTQSFFKVGFYWPWFCCFGDLLCRRYRLFL